MAFYGQLNIDLSSLMFDTSSFASHSTYSNAGGESYLDVSSVVVQSMINEDLS